MKPYAYFRLLVIPLTRHEVEEAIEAIPTMSDYFPEEILEEIFLRLPTKSILRFRCINKRFCTLFDSRRFQGMYHDLYNMMNNASYMLFEARNNKRYGIDYNSVCSLLPLSTSSTTTRCDFPEIIKPDVDLPSLFQDFDNVHCLDEIKSFYCIAFFKSSCTEFYIWNSKTNACQKIPTAGGANNGRVTGHGFGYDYQTDDCKLVMVVDGQDLQFSNVYVYTLSSNSWKNTQSLPCYFYYEYCHGKLYEGALHWLANTFGKRSVRIECFDIVNETFQEMALPEELNPYTEQLSKKDMFNIDVGVSEGCLCLVFNVYNVRIDVWMMQAYGVRESWAKSVSTTLESITSSRLPWLIWNFKNNETLWEVDEGLVLHDPNNKIYRKWIRDTECVTIAENSTRSLYLN